MAGPSDPIEELLRLIVGRERIGNSVSADMRARIRDLFERIERTFRDIDPTGVQRARYRRRRIERALDEIRRELRGFAPDMERELRAQLAAIGRQQAEKAQLGLVATLGTQAANLFTPEVGITQQRLRAILNTDPIRGRTLREHTQTWAAAQYNRARDQIRLGMANEEPMADIVQRVMGTPAGWKSDTTGRMRKTGGPGAHRLYRGGVMSRAEQDVEAIVRTAVTHVSSVGMMETFRANERVVSGVEYVATLDDRTTIICASLDGTVWPLDSGEIVTPGDDTHYGCRSVLVPVVGWEGLGLEPPPDGTRAARDMRTVDDADMDRTVGSRRGTGGFGQVEQIPTSVKAREWLRGQRPSVQNRVLGKTRADLFRSGEVSLRDLVRGDNTVIPLDELLRN